MFRHLKCHPQGAHCVLLKLHTDFLFLEKYKMISFNEMLIVQPLCQPFITLYNQQFIEVYHFIFY